jgi:hypothetical protein
MLETKKPIIFAPQRKAKSVPLSECRQDGRYEIFTVFLAIFFLRKKCYILRNSFPKGFPLVFNITICSYEIILKYGL